MFLVGGPQAAPTGPALAAPAATAQSDTTGVPAPVLHALRTPDGRTAELIDLGAPGGGALLDRIAAELPGAAEAVTAFWGERWP